MCSSDLGRSSRRFPAAILTTKPQTCNQVLVALVMAALEVIEQAPAPVDHLQQSAAGGVVLLMAFEMAGELSDAFAQDGHLDLRRTSVLGMNTILLDYRSLLSTYQGHSVYYPF